MFLPLLLGAALITTLHFEEGDVVPFKLELSGELIDFADEPPTLNVVALTKFSVTFDHEGEDILFSLDGENWKPFDTIFGGNLSAAVVMEEDSPFGLISLETHFKE